MEESGQKPVKFNKSELDRMVRELKLSEENCVILLEVLKEKHLMEKSIDVHAYDHREQEIVHFFDELEGDTVYLKNVVGLLNWANCHYNSSEWLLDIRHLQLEKRIECTLKHKPKKYASRTFLESGEIDDPFETLKQALEKADYRKHRWQLKGDFSAVSDARRSRRFTMINGQS